MMIKMVNICKGYMVGEEKVQVLKNINFNVDEGEFVAILGPSGSGKTTPSTTTSTSPTSTMPWPSWKAMASSGA